MFLEITFLNGKIRIDIKFLIKFIKEKSDEDYEFINCIESKESRIFRL